MSEIARKGRNNSKHRREREAQQKSLRRLAIAQQFPLNLRLREKPSKPQLLDYAGTLRRPSTISYNSHVGRAYV